MKCVKKPEVDKRITQLIHETGKSKTQLAQFLNLRSNTLRVWFNHGKFPLKFKQAMADFLGKSVEEIEATGLSFFGGDRQRLKFVTGEVSEKTLVILTENARYTYNLAPLIVNLAALLAFLGKTKARIKAISGEEFERLALLDWQNGRHLSVLELEKELLTMRKEKVK
jgi:hypothetical protein